MVERDGSGQRPGARKRWTWVFLAVGMFPAACSGSSSDGAVAQTTSPVGITSPGDAGAGTTPSAPAGSGSVSASGTNASAILQPAEIDPMSEYVFALCRLDPVSYLGDDDPLASMAAAIEELPATTGDEQAEAAFLASSLMIAADADNIVESTEMQQVVNLLQARCN